MLSLVGLFSDPNLVCIWELMKCTVFTKIKAGFVSATILGRMDVDFHAQGCSQAGPMVDHMDISTQSEISPNGIWASPPPRGRKKTGRGGGKCV